MSALLEMREPSERYFVSLQPAVVQQFEVVATAPEGVARLRELILAQAVRGKLVPQDANDEPAENVLARIRAERQQSPGYRRAKATLAAEASDAPYQLPEHWCWSSLADIGVINPRVYAPDDTVASFVQMSSVPTAYSEVHATEPRRWREIKSGFTHFAEGDVGVAKITPCFENGKSTVFSNLSNGIGAGTTELHVVRPLAGIVSGYVLIFLKSPDFLREGESVMTGSAGQKRLPRSYFENKPFPMPPLAEQARIVARVDELMRLCDALEAKGRLEAEQHARLLSTLLGTLTDSRSPEELAANWQRVAAHFNLLLDRPEAVEALEQAVLQVAVCGLLALRDVSEQPEELGKPVAGHVPYELPTNWQWLRFSQVADIASNLVSPAAYQAAWQVAPDCIEKGTGRLVERRTVAQAGVKSANHRFVAGQLLYSKIRPSLSKVVRVDFAGLCSADIYPVNARIDADYLLIYMLSRPFLDQVRIAENRVKMPKLNQEALNGFLVAVPPRAEQHRIVARVAQLRSLCADLRQRLAASQATQARLADALVAEVV